MPAFFDQLVRAVIQEFRDTTVSVNRTSQISAAVVFTVVGCTERIRSPDQLIDRIVDVAGPIAVGIGQ